MTGVARVARDARQLPFDRQGSRKLLSVAVAGVVQRRDVSRSPLRWPAVRLLTVRVRRLGQVPDDLGAIRVPPRPVSPGRRPARPGSGALPDSFPANTPDAADYGQGLLLEAGQLAEMLGLGVAAGRSSGACIWLPETVSSGIWMTCSGRDWPLVTVTNYMLIARRPSVFRPGAPLIVLIP
jgi:hypothetical protein